MNAKGAQIADRVKLQDAVKMLGPLVADQEQLCFGLQQRSIGEIRPYGGKVILRVDPDEWVSPGGIIMGAGTIEREKLLIATVVAVGDWMRYHLRKGKSIRVPIEFKPGDRVLINRSYAFCTLNDRNERFPELIIVGADQIEPGILEDV